MGTIRSGQSGGGAANAWGSAPLADKAFNGAPETCPRLADDDANLPRRQAMPSAVIATTAPPAIATEIDRRKVWPDAPGSVVLNCCTSERFVTALSITEGSGDDGFSRDVSTLWLLGNPDAPMLDLGRVMGGKSMAPRTASQKAPAV